MKADKALLPYAGRRQFERAVDLLAPRCEQVFLSVREDQADAPEYAALPRIADSVAIGGPMAGILSALKARRDAAWLVLACDLPYLDGGTLDHLLGRRRAGVPVTAYASAHDGLPEPLCAVYEPEALPALERLVASGITCPRKALVELGVPLLAPVNPRALENINTPEEYERARDAAGGGVL